MKLALIVNASSRRGGDLFAEAERILSSSGQNLILSEAVPQPDLIPDAIDRAVKAGAERIVLGGGDGTISSSSKQIADAGVEMAVLPLGTANSFARSVGVPLDVAGACRLALEGSARRADLGILGDHHFTNVAAIGLPAQIGRTIPDGLKRVLGRSAYLFWALYKLMRFRGFTCTVDDGSGASTHEVVEVRVANASNLGSLEAVPDADPEDHEIVVQLVRGTTNWQLAKEWAAMAVGQAPEIGEVKEIRGTRIHIETRPPQPVSVDGEVLARTPAEVRVAPAALRLVMPE